MHLEWIKASLGQCVVPEEGDGEEKGGIKGLAERLNLREIRELIEILAETVSLLETRSDGMYKEGLLAELLNEDISEALEKAKRRLESLFLTFNSKE